MIPQPVEDFRKEFQNTRVSRFYSGYLHVASTAVMLFGVSLFSIFQLTAIQGGEWIIVPITFLGGNLVEYIIHRYPLHIPMSPLKFLYKIHTLEHHR